VYLEDVMDLRTKLDEAMGALGLTTGYPADPALARGPWSARSTSSR
jgi:hypothetical protein